MTEVIRSDGIEIKKKVIQQILLRGSGDSKFNNHINKSLKLGFFPYIKIPTR